MHSFYQIKNDEFNDVMLKIQNFGFDYVSLGLRQPWENSIFCYFTDRRWEKYYIENEWYDNDPLVQASGNVIEAPILWSAVAINTKKSAIIMKTRNEIANINDGITFSLRGKNFSHILALGSSKDRVSLLDMFIDHYQEIQESLIYAEEIVKKCHEK